MKKILSAILVLSLAASLISLLSSCGDSDTITLNVYNWGEYISDGSEGSLNINEEFEKYYFEKYGVKIDVNYTTYDSNESMYSKISKGGSTYDVIIPSDYMIGKLIEDDLLYAFNPAETVENYSHIRDEFKDYSGFIFTDYRGMTVQQITDIRKALKKDEAAYRVVKNRYAKIALKDLDRTGAEEQMKGPTAVALVKGDTANTVAKVLFNANKDGVSIQVKGALLDGKFMSAEEVEALSKLPTKLELIASLMGTMKAPVQKLAATLLAYVESKGGAPAEAATESEN